MKGFIKSLDKKTQKLNTTDIALTKVAVIFFTLTIAKLWTGILALDWYYYAIPWILTAIKPISKFFGK